MKNIDSTTRILMEYCIGNFWCTPLEMVSKFPLSELINFYSHLKSSETRRCSDDFRWNRSKINHLNSFNIWTEISRRSYTSCMFVLLPNTITKNNKLVLESIFIKKESLAQVFSCEFCEISKNTSFQNTSGRLLLQGLAATIFRAIHQ